MYSISNPQNSPFKNLRQLYICIYICLGSHLIANGDVSDDFYVSTRPSSPPTQLLCIATSANTMRFEWQNPLFMPDLESISFLYNLTPENTSELHSCKFDIFV